MNRSFPIPKTAAIPSLALGRILWLIQLGLLPAPHEMKQFLGGRLNAAVATLLRHRAANMRARRLPGVLLIDPQFG